MALLRSAFTVSFFIALSRIAGFARDILIARFMGVSMLSDVFFAAFRLPNFFRRIFAEGAFNAAFVPLFIEKSQSGEGSKAELIFARNILSLLIYSLVALIVIFQIFMPFFMSIIFPGFTDDPQKFALLVNLSRITIFYLLFISIVSLFASILNSLNYFAAGASTSIILNIVLIFSLYVITPLVPNVAYALSWGVFIAGILQLVWLIFFLLKAGVIIYPSLPKMNDEIRVFFRKLLPGIIGANVMQINLLVDTMIASLIAGAVSYLYYADRVNQLPLAMIGIAINIALLPALSRKIKSGNEKEAIGLQNLALQFGLTMAIPAALALGCLAHPIISVLFERGEFGADASSAVAKALSLFSVALPAYVAVKIMEPSFFSRGDTKTPMKIAIICLISNIILNLSFIKPFGYLGIVMASVISSYLNLSLLLYHLFKKEYFAFKKGFFGQLVKIILASGIMLIFLIYVGNFFHINSFFSPMLELAIIIAGGLVIFAIPSYLLGLLDFKKLSLINNIK